MIHLIFNKDWLKKIHSTPVFEPATFWFSDALVVLYDRSSNYLMIICRERLHNFLLVLFRGHCRRGWGRRGWGRRGGSRGGGRRGREQGNEVGQVWGREEEGWGRV